MRIRKNARLLTATERDEFLAAILAIKAAPHPVYAGLSIYDYYVTLHKAATAVVRAGTATATNMAHFSDVFLPWHRELLMRFEDELRAFYPNVTIPYWDWTYPGAGDPLFADDFMGPVRGTTSANLASGYFAFNAPATLPSFWPAGLPGFRVPGALDTVPGSTAVAVRRNVPGFTDTALQTAATTGVALLDTALGFDVYQGPSGFRQFFEAGGVDPDDGVNKNGPHAAFHFWFGGQSHMANPAVSPNDPMFWMHHANVDRLWALWQRDGHEVPPYYPATTTPAVFGLNDPMWPYGWGYAPTAVGAPAQIYTGLGTALSPWPSSLTFVFEGGGATADPSKFRTPADVLDHLALGYRYDTEVVLGMTVDRSGSMAGAVPAPATGTPLSVSSKWEAAKLAVAATMSDCEAAFAAMEGSVIAGITTFTSAGLANDVSSLLAIPFGLVKSGNPYSAAAVQSAFSLLAPAGGTPIAEALTRTESVVVRSVEPSGAADDARYLAILTDGLETSAPLLNTLATAQFPNTFVSAMGFGMGSGWDGVSYSAIDTIVSKGASAPPGTVQAFHGDSVEQLDKFFHNTLATALGYTPFSDPSFELFGGEHTHMPFVATSFDSSFFIVVQGMDFDSTHWHVALIGPDGARYEANARGAIRVERKTLRGRTTFFLRRVGATAAAWSGEWRVEVMYGAGGHDHGRMVMPEVLERLVPTGALPLAGPVYTRHRLTPSKRPVVRLLPSPQLRKGFQPPAPPHDPGHVHGAAVDVVAPALEPSIRATMVHDHAELPPCAFTLNIHHKGSLRAWLETAKGRARAGRSYEVVLRLEGVNRAALQDLRAVGRLVGPATDPQAPFRDGKTIPPEARKKYMREVEGKATFDELAYLADYEERVPGAFPARNEVFPFRLRADGHLVATLAAGPFPGIHRVIALVQASLPLDDGRYELVERTVELEVLVAKAIDGKRLRKAAAFVGDVRTGLAYNAALDLAKAVPEAHRVYFDDHDEIGAAGLSHHHAHEKA
jgi:hypothetical protein